VLVCGSGPVGDEWVESSIHSTCGTSQSAGSDSGSQK
jgi:hypothetical protein